MTETNPPCSRRVLVVDDDARLGRTTAIVLAHLGHHPIVVLSAADALLAVAQHAIDVVLSDVGMPDLDGFGLLRELRARALDVPVILMTGEPRPDGAARARDAGAVGYLKKPFGLAELASAVESATRAR